MCEKQLWALPLFGPEKRRVKGGLMEAAATDREQRGSLMDLKEWHRATVHLDGDSGFLLLPVFLYLFWSSLGRSQK